MLAWTGHGETILNLDVREAEDLKKQEVAKVFWDTLQYVLQATKLSTIPIFHLFSTFYDILEIAEMSEFH